MTLGCFGLLWIDSVVAAHPGAVTPPPEVVAADAQLLRLRTTRIVGPEGPDPSRSEIDSTLSTQVRDLVRALAELNTAGEEASDPSTRLALLVRAAEAHEAMSEVLRASYVPAYLTADQAEIYRMRLEDSAYAQKETRREGLEAAAVLAPLAAEPWVQDDVAWLRASVAQQERYWARQCWATSSEIAERAAWEHQLREEAETWEAAMLGAVAALQAVAEDVPECASPDFREVVLASAGESWQAGEKLEFSDIELFRDVGSIIIEWGDDPGCEIPSLDRFHEALDALWRAHKPSAPFAPSCATEAPVVQVWHTFLRQPPAAWSVAAFEVPSVLVSTARDGLLLRAEELSVRVDAWAASLPPSPPVPTLGDVDDLVRSFGVIRSAVSDVETRASTSGLDREPRILVALADLRVREAAACLRVEALLADHPVVVAGRKARRIRDASLNLRQILAHEAAAALDTAASSLDPWFLPGGTDRTLFDEPTRQAAREILERTAAVGEPLHVPRR